MIIFYADSIKKRKQIFKDRDYDINMMNYCAEGNHPEQYGPAHVSGK